MIFTNSAFSSFCTVGLDLPKYSWCFIAMEPMASPSKPPCSTDEANLVQVVQSSYQFRYPDTKWHTATQASPRRDNLQIDAPWLFQQSSTSSEQYLWKFLSTFSDSSSAVGSLSISLHFAMIIKRSSTLYRDMVDVALPFSEVQQIGYDQVLLVLAILCRFIRADRRNTALYPFGNDWRVFIDSLLSFSRKQPILYQSFHSLPFI